MDGFDVYYIETAETVNNYKGFLIFMVWMVPSRITSTSQKWSEPTFSSDRGHRYHQHLPQPRH